MCSRSARFIPCEDPLALVLGHDHREWAALAHSLPVGASVDENREDRSQPSRLDDPKPFAEGDLGLRRVVRVSEEFFDPGNDQSELGGVVAEQFRDHGVQFQASFVDDLVPVHRRHRSTSASPSAIASQGGWGPCVRFESAHGAREEAGSAQGLTAVWTCP